ncbi:MAG: PDZ domain-containing protein [Cyanothece sp. SIO1E1]|nr:PDZ domain-containing protein [Cyanothece sp. SIO1E1]
MQLNQFNPQPGNSQLTPPHSSPKETRKRPFIYLSLLLLGGGIATAGSYLAWNPASPIGNRAIAQVSSRQNSTAAPAAPRSSLVNAIAPTGTNFISDVVERVGPAVVRINASRTVTRQTPDRFFGRFFGENPTAPSEQIQRGVGSGFIVSADGRIVTNAHVVEGADRVRVTLKDGRSFEGEVLGADPLTDVAVIQIESSNLPTVPLSDSDQIQPGQWAIAIGNPLGLDNTVTAGIISATGRSSGEVGVPDQRVSFIQTDTAINPGNSGGPLLNVQGEVIGVNTAIIQGAQGIGFAIPINMVQRVANQLVASGSVEHPYLGVQLATLTPQLRQEINRDPNSNISVDTDEGILIARVVPNSPAAQAGLRAGDVIRKIDGQDVTSSAELQRFVAAQRVGGNINLELRRNGQNLDLQAQLGALPRRG